MSWNAKRYETQRLANGGIGKRIIESVHHRKPTSIGGKNDERNRSELPVSRHRAWHTIVQNWDVPRIVDELNNRYIDPDWVLIAVRRGD